MRPELEVARQLIEDKQYDRARTILQRASDDPVAQQWLVKLEATMPRPIKKLNLSASTGTREEWQYAALEAKFAYGVQYRFNSCSMPDWKDQPIYFALNELGRDGWELVGFDGREDMTVYILKKQGRAQENRKVEVWDQ